MPVDVDKIQSSEKFPTKVDVAIIGGGIVGACAAYEMALKGLSVALLEKGHIGGEQSSRNWGWVRQQNRDLFELPMAMYSLDRWEALGPELGVDLGFRRSGIVFTTTQDEDMQRWERWNNRAREQGFVSHLMTSAQARERSPGSTTSWVGGVWSPTDGRAEPAKAAPAIADGARKLGAYVVQQCAVRGLEIVAGRAAGVWTERGLIKADSVVCAGGAWSSRLCRRHGIDLPIANIVGTAMRTTPVPEFVGGGVSTPNLSLRRRLDGCYTLAIPGFGRMELAPQGIRYAARFYQVYRAKLAKKLKIRIGSSFFNGPEAAGSWEMDQASPFERIRVLDPAPDRELLGAALANLIKEFPAFQGVQVAQSWAGLIDTTPDIVPVISTVDALPGFIIAAGMSGHGFGIGPGAGRLICEMVMNEKPYLNIDAYRLTRFSDGTQLRKPEMM